MNHQGLTASGWGTNTWCDQADISRTTLFSIPRESWPQHVRIGSKLRIIESPIDWLKRMAALGQIPTAQQRKAA